VIKFVSDLRLSTGRWFSPGIPVSSTSKTDRHDLNEILLKVALNTIIKQKRIQDLDFRRHVWSFVFNCLRCELVRFVDIGQIVDQHCFNFLINLTPPLL
jgi:hypothetical protein